MAKAMNMQEVPIDKKILLSFHEAALLSGIGINKLRALAKDPSCRWTFKNGCNTMVKRVELENYILKSAGM